MPRDLRTSSAWLEAWRVELRRSGPVPDVWIQLLETDAGGELCWVTGEISDADMGRVTTAFDRVEWLKPTRTVLRLIRIEPRVEDAPINPRFL